MFMENKIQTIGDCFLHHFLKPLLIVFLTALSRPALAYRMGNVEINASGAATETFDDNITYVKDNPKSDFITTGALGLDVKYEGKTQSLDIIGRLYEQLFAKNSKFDNTPASCILDFQKEFSRHDRLSINDGFLHTQQPVSFEDAFGRTPGRYGSYTNQFSLGYSHDISKQMTLTGRYANELDFFSSSDQSDSLLNSAGISLQDALSSSAILLFSYDLAVRSFDPGKSALTNSPTAGLTYYLTKKLYLEGSTGLDIIESYNDSGFCEPFVHLSLVHDVDKNTRAAIEFGHRFTTTAYEQNLFDYTKVSCSVTRQLLERLGVSFSGFYGEDKYIGAGIKDKLAGIGVGIAYDILRHTKGILRYNYERELSNESTREYTKNWVSAGIRVDF